MSVLLHAQVWQVTANPTKLKPASFCQGERLRCAAELLPCQNQYTDLFLPKWLFIKVITEIESQNV